MFQVGFLRTRSMASEAMDSLSVSGECFAQSFRFIHLVNRWFGGTRTTLKGLEFILQAWDKTHPVHLMDVGCGDGETLLEIDCWGRRHGYQFRFTAVDVRADFLDMARRRTQGLDVDFLEMNLLENRLPRADIVHCAMTLHHLDDQQCPVALKYLMSSARWGVVVNDLERSFAAYAGCWCLTRLFSDPICRADALESVRRGFTTHEFIRLLSVTGIKGTLQKRGWFRLCCVAQCSCQDIHG